MQCNEYLLWIIHFCLLLFLIQNFETGAVRNCFGRTMSRISMTPWQQYTPHYICIQFKTLSPWYTHSSSLRKQNLLTGANSCFFRLPLFEKSTTHYEQKESSVTSTRIYNLHTKEYNKTNTKLFAEATPAEIQHLSKGWSGRRSPIAVDPGLCPGGRCPAASASLMQRHRPVSALKILRG